MEWKIRGKVILNAKMKKYTSMKVGGPVRYLVYPEDESELIEVIKILNKEGMKWRVLGNGTNVIISDRGLNEALIRITKFKKVSFKRSGKTVTARVAGGYMLKNLILRLANLGLSGLERMYSIPGSVGGAVKMNAGSFGVSISDTLKYVKYVSPEGNEEVLPREKISFSYRSSPFHSNMCITEVEFALEYGDKRKIIAEVEKVTAERKKRHPYDMPSAGSIFKAVNGVPAWKYIEKAGLKGLKIGDACVSEKHANFIVNLGKAKAQDVKDLIDKIKKEVFEKEGVMLEEEVELWGFDD